VFGRKTSLSARTEVQHIQINLDNAVTRGTEHKEEEILLGQYLVQQFYNRAQVLAYCVAKQDKQ